MGLSLTWLRCAITVERIEVLGGDFWVPNAHHTRWGSLSPYGEGEGNGGIFPHCKDRNILTHLADGATV